MRGCCVAAEEKLRALGMIPSEIEALARRGIGFGKHPHRRRRRTASSPRLSVREGMYIQPNTTIMSLADLSSVWLQAEVFESQADWVAAGQAAEARLEYMPGAVFSGQVDYVYPVLDPVTRTLRVRLRFDNPDERLKPNMYARVSIYGRLQAQRAEHSARSADSARRAVTAWSWRWAMAASSVHEVLTGMESGSYVEILAGIEEGDEIVTSAQFLIDSEASLAGSIKRLEVGAESEEQRTGGAFSPAAGSTKSIRQSAGVRISHGPIEALGWPSMTMVFDVRPRSRPGRHRSRAGHPFRTASRSMPVSTCWPGCFPVATAAERDERKSGRRRSGHGGAGAGSDAGRTQSRPGAVVRERAGCANTVAPRARRRSRSWAGPR